MIAKDCICCNRKFMSGSVGDDLCSTECEDKHRNLIAEFNSLKKNAKWLTHSDEIPAASNESLVRSLATADGRGLEFKRKALAELIIRSKLDAFSYLQVPENVLEFAVTDGIKLNQN